MAYGLSLLQSGRWWEAEGDSLPTTLSGWAAHLESFDFDRRARNLLFARLATNRDLPNIYGLSLARTNMAARDFRDWKAPVFNVTGSSVETLVNKVGRNKPWILFLTDGGDFGARMAGKKRSRFVDGVFHETKTYALTRQMFQDALTYGDGFIKATKSLDGKTIVHDVVLADELLIDPWDSLYFGKWPRSLIHRTFVSRTELLSIFGDDDEIAFAIETAPGSFQGPMWGGMSATSQTAMVGVLEGWKLPDADGTPGRHVLCISDKIALVDEKYESKRYPFTKMSCISAGRGFWNIGIPEILAPFQTNINRTQQVIDECFPAGTPVDGRPIETYKPGDIVACVDHTTGVVTSRPVVCLFEKTASSLVQIAVADRKITCTANHPVFVAGRGYVNANDLRPGDMLCVRNGVLGAAREGAEGVLEGVPSGAPVSASADTEPHVEPGDPREDVGVASSSGAQAECPSLQRRADAGRTGPVAGAGTGVADGRGGPDEGEAPAWVRVSDLLQVGSGGHLDQDGYRGRWSEPRQPDGARAGCEEDGALVWARVESVSRDERGSAGAIAVYNLEVEGAHTYFADGVLVHNCQRRMSTGRWLVPTGSGVTDDALGSKAAGIIRHAPNLPPSFVVPQAVPGDLYAHLDKTIERAYKRAGISELAAQAMKPAGLNSGEALRAFESAESERYVTLGMQFEEAVLGLAELDLELAEDIRPTVRAPRAGGIDVIDWKELATIKGNHSIMKAFPISSLPTSPAGRLQRAAEMFQVGQISKEDYLRIIDYPDTQAVIELVTAGRDAIDWMLDKIVEDGIFESPEPYMNLDITKPGNAIEVAQNRYLRERTQGCPEERLELLRRFMQVAKDLDQKNKVQQTPAAPAMNGLQAAAAGLPPPTAAPVPVIQPGGPMNGTSTMPIAA